MPLLTETDLAVLHLIEQYGPDAKVVDFWDLVPYKPGVFARLFWRYVLRTERTQASLATIYTSITRLEERRLITSRWGEPSESYGGQRPRLYTSVAYDEKIREMYQSPEVDLLLPTKPRTQGRET